MAKIAFLLLLGTMLMPGVTLAEPIEVSSADLIERAKELDLREVLYTGEVIGDIMARGDHTWINASDGANAIGIWASSADLVGISTPGRYGMRGDQVCVTGQFHRACPEHGGDMDIHAGQVQLLTRGYPIPHEVRFWRMITAALLTLANIGLLLYIIHKRRRR